MGFGDLQPFTAIATERSTPNATVAANATARAVALETAGYGRTTVSMARNFRVNFEYQQLNMCALLYLGNITANNVKRQT